MLQYQNNAAAYVTFASGLTFFNGTMFHGLKLVINSNTEKYVRVMFDNQFYDLSTLDLYTTASAIPPSMRVVLFLTTLANANHTGHVDSVIITQNEP